MTIHRSHSATFKRQVAEEFIAGETLHGLSQRHDVSCQLIQIWVGKFEAGALDEDVQVADLIQEYEGRIAALERLVGKQVLELDLLKGGFKTHSSAEKREYLRRHRPSALSVQRGCELMGLARSTFYDASAGASDTGEILIRISAI